ncbi:glucosaminidase domain-containing protein [Listeria floridensis]|nr:glucosaminidase domain-containing protein [Listeria floridensis]
MLRNVYLEYTAPDPAYGNKEQRFINQLLPRAQEIQKEHNILTSVTLAQAILESNWGESALAQKGNNLFGVKASAGAPIVNMTTKEFQDGKWIEIKANFRKYQSWNESLDDHAALFLNGTSWAKDKYRSVIEAKDYKAAAQAIMDAGYATDPTYASKLTSLIETYDLTSYDQVGAKWLTNKRVSYQARVKKDADGTVYGMPYGLPGATKNESLAYYARDTITVIRKATTSTGKWLQFTVGEKTAGWVKAELIQGN